MEKTKIDWCDSTWNPVTGCLHGCEYCYARNIAHRFSAGGEKWTDDKLITLDEKFYGDEDETANPYPYGFIPTLHRYRMNDYATKKGRNIFVCSMADLFGDWVPDSWIEEVFKACDNAPQHNYLFLTKNPSRYVELINRTDFFVKTKNNMWFGYSYTKNSDISWWNPDYNIFASIEPIMEPIIIPRCKWVIVGAETGRRKDKVIPKREWIEKIVDDCRKSSIPVFMKSSLAEIWGEPLIQEFPKELQKCWGGKTMRIGVTEIKETDYLVDINTRKMSKQKKDELYRFLFEKIILSKRNGKISCEPCTDNILDVKNLLDDLGVEYEIIGV